MTHKEYLRRVRTIEYSVHGAEKHERLTNIEKERMDDLDHHLDKDFIEAMDDGSYDESLESEYGDLF